MIPPQVLKYVGVGVIVLAVIGVVLWQANALMSKGVELGKAQARIATLESTLEEDRATCRGNIDSLSFHLENCGADLAAETEKSERYRRALADVELTQPEPVTIEIESKECVGALMEGHVKAIRQMEAVQ